MGNPEKPKNERPDWACVLCRPPVEDQDWKRADEGYATCCNCLDRLRENIREVSKRYAQLDTTPGSRGDSSGRGSPGFGSKPTADLHVIVMTDPRSSEVAKVWVAADGRIHFEDERPPLAVFSELDKWAWDIAENRSYDNGHGCTSVADICVWLDNQLDWSTRQATIVEYAPKMRRLVSQLKSATGERRVYIGDCTRVIDEGAHVRVCGKRLYVPLRGDTVECWGCGSEWPREKWLKLGDLLDAS